MDLSGRDIAGRGKDNSKVSQILGRFEKDRGTKKKQEAPRSFMGGRMRLVAQALSKQGGGNWTWVTGSRGRCFNRRVHSGEHLRWAELLHP